MVEFKRSFLNQIKVLKVSYNVFASFIFLFSFSIQGQIFNKLINLGIKNLFYAGYHLNNEMIWSKYGMANLYMHKVYYEMKEKLPKTYVVKDMSFIVDSKNYDSSKEKIILLNYYRGLQNIPSKYLLKKLK